MSKRKSVTETQEVETTPPERVHKAGGQAEIVSGERWHILYTPQWRTQVDLGEFNGTLPNAFGFVLDSIASNPELIRLPYFNDPIEVSEGVWMATGSDGIMETTLSLVTITRVTE